MARLVETLYVAPVEHSRRYFAGWARVRIILVQLGGGISEAYVRTPLPSTLRSLLDALGLPYPLVRLYTCSGRPLPLSTLLGRNACIKLVVVESPG